MPERIWIAALQVFRSDDYGESWEPVEAGTDKLILTRDRFLGFNGYSDDLGGGTRIIESVDRGETWREVEVPDEVGYFRSVLEAEGGRLYVGRDEGVWLMEPPED